MDRQCPAGLNTQEKDMTKEEQDIKRLTYLFEHDHKEYGKLSMVRLIDNERYCFFVKDNLVSMIPYFMVENND